MSKILIINKLNKCNAFNLDHNLKLFDDSTSKMSVSTKTHESPQPNNFNSEFTLNENSLKEVFQVKSKASKFFQSFDFDLNVIYQKVYLAKSKILERPLEFELMNLYREGLNQSKGAKHQFEKISGSVLKNIPENLQTAKGSNKYLQILKTEQADKTLFVQAPPQFQYQEYFQSLPYDSKKYKLLKEKCINKKFNYNPKKRIQTQNVQIDTTMLESCAFNLGNQQQNTSFDDYHFRSKNPRQTQGRHFNRQDSDFRANQTINEVKCNFENDKQPYQFQPVKRQGNSRLCFFRKQRENQIRKSANQENKISKQFSTSSNENKENAKSNSKLVPCLKNMPEIGLKKLKSQYSQRFLLKEKSKNDQFKKQILYSKGSVHHLSKESEQRIKSIRNQLNLIYFTKDKRNKKLQVQRNQETYQKNTQNSLRRVGSILRF